MSEFAADEPPTIPRRSFVVCCHHCRQRFELVVDVRAPNTLIGSQVRSVVVDHRRVMRSGKERVEHVYAVTLSSVEPTEEDRMIDALLDESTA
jgi:hypothetical protein